MTADTTPLATPSWPRALRYRASQALRHLAARVLLLLLRERAFTAGRWFARAKYRLVRNRYQAYVEEMSERLGTTRAEADVLLERCFEVTVSEHIDTSRHRRMTRADLDRVIEIRGLEHLTAALDRREGAILYSGHVCGHYTFFLALSLLGFPVTMLGFVEQQDRWMPRRWQSFYERRYEMLWMKEANFGIAVHAVNALRRNRIVTIEIDHTTSKSTVDVDFLAGRARFPTGPALIGQASGAPLLHFWVNRTERWVPQTATIGRPFYVSDDIPNAVKHCAATLETEIRADPASWSTWLYPTKLLWADTEGS